MLCVTLVLDTLVGNTSISCPKLSRKLVISPPLAVKKCEVWLVVALTRWKSFLHSRISNWNLPHYIIISQTNQTILFLGEHNFEWLPIFFKGQQRALIRYRLKWLNSQMPRYLINIFLLTTIKMKNANKEFHFKLRKECDEREGEDNAPSIFIIASTPILDPKVACTRF